MKKSTHTIAALANALGADAGWTGALVERMGGKVKADGTFDAQHLCDVLDKWAPKKGGAGKVNLPVREEMGDTPERCRQFLKRELCKHGMKLIPRHEDRDTRMTFDRPNGERIWVLSFVALKAKSNPGQVGFMTGPGENGNYNEWYCFVARPFGKVYALSKRDMEYLWLHRKKELPLGRMPLTFSQGVDATLLENRIDEMLGIAETSEY